VIARGSIAGREGRRVTRLGDRQGARGRRRKTRERHRAERLPRVRRRARRSIDPRRGREAFSESPATDDGPPECALALIAEGEQPRRLDGAGLGVGRGAREANERETTAGLGSCPGQPCRRDVELEGIEPSSGERSSPVLRPFPSSRRYGCRPAGSGGSEDPTAGSFPDVSGLSHRQRSVPAVSTASVAGLRWTDPVRRYRSR